MTCQGLVNLVIRMNKAFLFAEDMSTSTSNRLVVPRLKTASNVTFRGSIAALLSFIYIVVLKQGT